MQPNPFLDKVRRVVRIVCLLLFFTLTSIHSLRAQNLESIGSPAWLQFASTNFIVAPAATNVLIAVTRCNNISEPVSVDFQTQDGTAVAGRDYVAAAGTLDFAVGETQKIFSVTILTADANRNDLSINLSLFAPTYSGVITSGAATLIIAGMPRLTIRPAGNATTQLSWPCHATNYVLEITDKPVGGTWTQAAEAPVLTNGVNVVTHCCATTMQFFRLRQKSDE